MTDSAFAPRRVENPTEQQPVLPSLVTLPGASISHAANQQTLSPVHTSKWRLWTQDWLRLCLIGAISTVCGFGVIKALRREVSAYVVSGAPTVRSSRLGKELRWHKNEVKIWIDDSVRKLGPQAQDAVELGFVAWSGTGAIVPELRFERLSTSAATARDGKNTVSVAPIDIPGHTQDLALTVAYSDDASGEILEADIIFNSRYKYGTLVAKRQGQGTAELAASESESCDQRYDLQNVATHEAGHFLGLGEDYVETLATMYKSTDRCETHKRQVTTTDETAILALYPPDLDGAPTVVRACGVGVVGVQAVAGISSMPVGVFIGLIGWFSFRRRNCRE